MYLLKVGVARIQHASANASLYPGSLVRRIGQPACSGIG